MGPSIPLVDAGRERGGGGDVLYRTKSDSKTLHSIHTTFYGSSTSAGSSSSTGNNSSSGKSYGGNSGRTFNDSTRRSSNTTYSGLRGKFSGSVGRQSFPLSPNAASTSSPKAAVGAAPRKSATCAVSTDATIRTDVKAAGGKAMRSTARSTGTPIVLPSNTSTSTTSGPTTAAETAAAAARAAAATMPNTSEYGSSMLVHLSRSVLSLRCIRKFDPRVHRVIYQICFVALYQLDKVNGKWMKIDVQGGLLLTERLPIHTVQFQQHEQDQKNQKQLYQPPTRTDGCTSCSGMGTVSDGVGAAAPKAVETSTRTHSNGTGKVGSSNAPECGVLVLEKHGQPLGNDVYLRRQQGDVYTDLSGSACDGQHSGSCSGTTNMSGNSNGTPGKNGKKKRGGCIATKASSAPAIATTKEDGTRTSASQQQSAEQQLQQQQQQHAVDDSCKYRMFILNQRKEGIFFQNIKKGFEIEGETNHIFYRTWNPATGCSEVYALWIYEDKERQELQQMILEILSSFDIDCGSNISRSRRGDNSGSSSSMDSSMNGNVTEKIGVNGGLDGCDAGVSHSEMVADGGLMQQRRQNQLEKLQQNPGATGTRTSALMAALHLRLNPSEDIVAAAEAAANDHLRQEKQQQQRQIYDAESEGGKAGRAILSLLVGGVLTPRTRSASGAAGGIKESRTNASDGRRDAFPAVSEAKETVLTRSNSNSCSSSCYNRGSISSYAYVSNGIGSSSNSSNESCRCSSTREEEIAAPSVSTWEALSRQSHSSGNDDSNHSIDDNAEGCVIRIDKREIEENGYKCANFTTVSSNSGSRDSSNSTDGSDTNGRSNTSITGNNETSSVNCSSTNGSSGSNSSKSSANSSSSVSILSLLQPPPAVLVQLPPLRAKTYTLGDDCTTKSDASATSGTTSVTSATAESATTEPSSTAAASSTMSTTFSSNFSILQMLKATAEPFLEQSGLLQRSRQENEDQEELEQRQQRHSREGQQRQLQQRLQLQQQPKVQQQQLETDAAVDESTAATAAGEEEAVHVNGNRCNEMNEGVYVTEEIFSAAFDAAIRTKEFKNLFWEKIQNESARFETNAQQHQEQQEEKLLGRDHQQPHQRQQLLRVQPDQNRETSQDVQRQRQHVQTNQNQQQNEQQQPLQHQKQLQLVKQHFNLVSKEKMQQEQSIQQRQAQKQQLKQQKRKQQQNDSQQQLAAQQPKHQQSRKQQQRWEQNEHQQKQRQ